MSRVDEALRRASLDMTAVHSPVAVDPSATAVDGSALEAYAGERRTAAPKQEKPRSAVVAATRPVERYAAFHASLEGKAVISRETNPVSIEQYRRLATTLHSIQ